jgi:hypothetical protein
MPYSKCPICGNVSHLSIGNIEDWYRHLYPGIPLGSLVPGKCVYCWQELEIGDRIVIRERIGTELLVESGTRGQLVAVLSSPDHGNIYKVRLDSQRERYFVRGELRKLRDDEA